jgi:hypothetical protein
MFFSIAKPCSPYSRTFSVVLISFGYNFSRFFFLDPFWARIRS